jgi:hypothetical protein
VVSWCRKMFCDGDEGDLAVTFRPTARQEKLCTQLAECSKACSDKGGAIPIPVLWDGTGLLIFLKFEVQYIVRCKHECSKGQP